MKISQELTPAAFEFGCTSAACAPPNRKGTGGSGGSIKGQTKGGGPHFSDDQQIAALAKAMGRTANPGAKQSEIKYLPRDTSKDKKPNTELYRGTGGTTGTGGAGGGRSSMKSSVNMDKSRAIAAARGDNTRNANGNPPGTPDDEPDMGDAEHRAHDNQTPSKAEQRAIDFKREQAKHNSRQVEGAKAAALKKKQNSQSLAEYKKMIRDRNRIL